MNAMKSPMKLVVLIACFPLSAVAQSLQCGEKTISEGTTQAEVAARCGQPAQIERRTIYSEGGTATADGPAPIGGPAGGPAPGKPVPVLPGIGTRSATEDPVELWTYNFGPSRLMQRIRFENGVVVHIESLGYGF
jgi:Protein of unknown function (DUF2845)